MGFCEHCVYENQRRVSFLKLGKYKKKERLDLIHTNVWGPTQVTSLGDSSYFATFINESTRNIYVYCNKNKLDMIETFNI